MSYETYGFFQKEFLNHRKGTLIESDEHFLNIYDCWVLKHAFFFFFFFFFLRRNRWYHSKLTKLEETLRRKWERTGAKIKTLPIIDVLILKITEEDKAFDQTKYLNEKEQSFTNLESWKMAFEE